VQRGWLQVQASEHLSVGYQVELDWFHMPPGVRPIALARKIYFQSEFVTFWDSNLLGDQHFIRKKAALPR
jgi:hypothetical protein